MRIIRLARFTGTWLATRLQVKSDRGATAVEYGVMVALIAAVIIVAVMTLGQQASSTFNCTAEAIRTKTNGCGS
ncbi:MAG: Flp family type IVb pilin [Actinomycetota bacterium]